MGKKLLGIASALTALAISASVASAGSVSVSFNGGNDPDTTSTGNGNVLGLLSLKDSSQSAGSEWGTTGWNGTTYTYDADPSTQVVPGNPDAASAYRARSVTDLLTVFSSFDDFVNNFAVTFQINEGGAEGTDNLKLKQFSINFYHGTTGANLFQGYFPGPGAGNVENPALELTGVGQGQSGYVFGFGVAANPLDAADIAELLTWWNGGGYVGLQVHIDNKVSDANSGADNFFVARSPNLTVRPPVVPLPAAAWSGLALMGALAIAGKIRKRRD
jgi:hypothetical protein